MDNKRPIVIKNPNHNNRQSLICVLLLVNKTVLFSHKESREEEKNASRNNVMRITGLRYVSSPSIFYFLSMTLVRYINLLL